MRTTLALGTVLSLAALACATDQPVEPPGKRPDADALHAHFLAATQVSRGAEDRIIAIDQATGSLGGLYFDSAGTLVVNLVDAPGAQAALAAAKQLLTSQPLLAKDHAGRPRGVRTARVRYRFSDLVAFQALAGEALRGLPELTQTDADERRNKLRIGLASSSARETTIRTLAAVGIPRDVVEIEVMEHIRPAASVQDKFRPTGGGIRIWAPHLPSPICSLGYNVTLGGQRYLLTNSHCVSLRDGNSIGASIYQNTVSGANLVGTVAVDPPWTVADPGCTVPTCRRSDAALVLYSAGVSAPSRVAKTTNVGTSSSGSLTFSSWLTVIDPSGNVPYVGLQNIYKVGQTSGTTQGSVVESCVNNPGAGFSVLCSDIVEAWADFGDSGSPVVWFPLVLAPNNRIPMGILYGVRTGPSGLRQYAFSRLSQIASELGPLVYH